MKKCNSCKKPYNSHDYLVNGLMYCSPWCYTNKYSRRPENPPLMRRVFKLEKYV